ncbi:MAG TPA: phage tail tape measure protein [Pseudolabrys sp.]|nr:phage tail tape measure protein [Pseudolabrys sp.]
MSDSDGLDETINPDPSDFPEEIERKRKSINGLGISATAFANAMTKAFMQATAGGKQFDEVLKSLALRLSSLTLAAAFKPVAKGLAGGLSDIFKGLFGDGQVSGNAIGAIKPFAAGGVIGTPTYFPLSSGGLGLAGEAGPEAIVPLTRGPDGRLGVAMAGAGAPVNVTVQIATPDAGSFRRSEAYITGQIARAVARGQRSL